MEGESDVFMYNGRMIDISKLDLDEVNKLLEEVDSEIEKLEAELKDSLFSDIIE